MDSLWNRGLVLAPLALGLTVAPAAPEARTLSFDYAARPATVQQVSSTDRDGVSIREITYKKAGTGRNAATLVLPAVASGQPRPAVLFVHWYEPPKPTSNRTEFVEDAVELAKLGTVSLLIDTPWSEPTWFPKRDSEKDYDMSVAQVKEIRRAAGRAPRRSRASIAHASRGRPRLRGDVRRAGGGGRSASRRISCSWPELDRSATGTCSRPGARGRRATRFIAELAPLDPIKYLPRIAPRPVLLQFATNDKFVSTDAAHAMADAVGTAKTVKYYDAEHELNAEATHDRQAWLKRELRLAP